MIIIDSQAVKNTCNASVDTKGFCFYNVTNGIKRHLAVDTLGFPSVAHWVIERPNAWMERCKILVKNFERTLDNATTTINLCSVRLMLKRLAAAS